MSDSETYNLVIRLALSLRRPTAERVSRLVRVFDIEASAVEIRRAVSRSRYLQGVDA